MNEEEYKKRLADLNHKHSVILDLDERYRTFFALIRKNELMSSELIAAESILTHQIDEKLQTIQTQLLDLDYDMAHMKRLLDNCYYTLEELQEQPTLASDYTCDLKIETTVMNQEIRVWLSRSTDADREYEGSDENVTVEILNDKGKWRTLTTYRAGSDEDWLGANNQRL